jgi:predicted cupin superfamily sugar epimerase
MLPPRYAGRSHAAGGAIMVVVTPRDFSAMHRLKTDEAWHFYGGSPLRAVVVVPGRQGSDGNAGRECVGRRTRAVHRAEGRVAGRVTDRLDGAQLRCCCCTSFKSMGANSPANS